MLEYRLEPEGGLLVCALGTLEVGGGQIVECSLCLSDIPVSYTHLTLPTIA